MDTKDKPLAFAAGQNVTATISGKEIGPIYCVQIADGKATLQGTETHVVPVADVKPIG